MKTQILFLCAALVLPAQAFAAIKHATLLNVHVLADGSLGDIQVLSSAGEDALAICVARQVWSHRTKFQRQTAVVDHWEKRSILIDDSDKPVTCG